MEKQIPNFLVKLIFFIFETKFSLYTSVFNFSTIFQIWKTKFYVFWKQKCRN